MKLKLSLLLLFTYLSIVTAHAQSFECRVENETFPSATTYEFDVKLYATGATTTWEYATGTYYINMNSAFRNAGTITASIVAGSSELNATQIPTSVTYQATNNYVIVAAKTPPGAGAGSIITQSGVRVVRMKLTNTANFSTTAAPNLAFRWATPNTNISAYVGGLNTPIANNTVTAGQKNCKTPNYWNGTSWNKGTPTDTTDAVIFAGTYTGSITARSLTINSGATYNQNGGNLVLTYPIRNFGTLNGIGTINGNYLIQSQSDANGTITPSGNYYTGTDSIHKFVFTPNTGYLLESVLINGILVDSTSSYTFKNVNANQTIRVTFKPVQYNINAQTGNNGQISSPGNTVWSYGNSLRYTFMPNTGYLVDSVIVNNLKVDSLWGYTFSNLNSDQTIRVTFKPIEINISSSSGNNGSISNVGNTKLLFGDSIRYTFSPNYGYELDSLIINGIKITSSPNYTFKNVLSNQSIRVTFKPIQSSIITYIGTNGQMNPSGITTLTYGNSMRFVFTPNTGYLVDSVIVNGSIIDSLTGYTFSDIITSQSIRVTFKPIQITINALAGSNGQISPIGISNLTYGNSLRYVITPNSGYLVDSVLVNGIKVDSLIAYTFSNVITNQSIRVIFKPIEISINALAGVNGTISKTGITKLTYGDSIRYSINPNYGYTIDSIVINGIKVENSSTYLFKDVLSNQTILATFKPIQSTINAYAGLNGQISSDGNTSILYGKLLKYFFIPNTDYKVDSVIVNGIKVDSTTSYTFSNVVTDQTIRVTFKLRAFNIITSSNNNGSLSPSGNVSVIYSKNQRIVFTPNTNYYVDSVLVDGIPVDSIVGYTFSNVTADHNLRVVYTLKYNVASVSQAANSNQYIAYQAYARNNAGASLNNKSIQVKFSLLTDSINGSVVYAESHTLSTNSMGLFTAEIGNGTPTQGTWQGINWSASKKYLKTEIDMGSGWVNMGTQQLLAVPYAIHSNTSSKSQTLENANLPVFNTNAAAINAGLLPGQLYRTTIGDLKVVY